MTLNKYLLVVGILIFIVLFLTGYRGVKREEAKVEAEKTEEVRQLEIENKKNKRDKIEKDKLNVCSSRVTDLEGKRDRLVTDYVLMKDKYIKVTNQYLKCLNR